MIEAQVDLQTREYTIDDIVHQAQRAMEMVDRVRHNIFAPEELKKPPVFSGAQLAALCGLDRGQFTRRLAKGDLPRGAEINAARREFTLVEAREWTRALGLSHVREAGERAITITTGNSKGGVAKTTTTMCLAQGLSLRGYRVLLVDLDPQGSLTSLCGVFPDTQVGFEDTVAPLCQGTEQSLRYAVRPTYWDGVDLIPASPSSFSAEFFLPSRQLRGEPDFQFYNVINAGLDHDGLRNEYDLVLIDTSPTLSYLSLNAFMAADGLLVPLPPKGMDFASSAQFWSLFSDLAEDIKRLTDVDKRWKFINVLMSMVDLNDASTAVVQSWISATYGDKVLPVEIPKTAVANVTGTQFGTVYDVSRYAGSAKTYERARSAYDRVVDLMDMQIRRCWPSAKAKLEARSDKAGRRAA